MVNCYRQSENALQVCTNQQRIPITEANKLYNKRKDIPVYKVEGFYLAHKSLFDELLKSIARTGGELSTSNA
jgi:hypothetical protein